MRMTTQPTRQKYDPDQLAERLGSMALQARRMPPSWKLGDQNPIMGMNATGDCDTRIATALPGKGIVLASDLKKFGITKPIPHVYERSPLMRLYEMLGDDVAAITTWDGVLSSRGSGKADDTTFGKASLTTTASVWHNCGRNSAGQPGALSYTAIPGGSAPDYTTTGALSWAMVAPSGGDTKYLLTFGFQAAQQINFGWLVDLLVACGSISATLNTSQTVSSTALTRYTTGVGVLGTFDVTTAIGTTASNVTVTYTNTASVGSRSSGAQAMTVSSIVTRLLPITVGPFFPLQAGDVGILSVQSVILSAAMTAGAMALLLYKPLMWMPGVAAAVYIEKASTTQLQNFVSLATTGGGNLGCLQFFVIPNTTSTGVVNGTFCACAG